MDLNALLNETDFAWACPAWRHRRQRWRQLMADSRADSMTNLMWDGFRGLFMINYVRGKRLSG